MAGEMSLGKILIEFGVELGDLKSGLKQVTEQLDQQKKKTEEQGSSLSGLSQKWFFVKNAMQDVWGVAKDMLDAWASQERAVNQLNLSLANQGNLLPGVSQMLQDQATALQRTTTFADDAITSGQALLATSGKTAQEIKAATPAILDMASAMGMDLNAAFGLATKAAVGQTSVLSRYGIKIAEGIPENQKFAAVIKQLETRFGGMAEVVAQDATGRIQQFSNAVGDAKEGVGKFIEFFITSTVGMGGSAFPVIERIGRFFGEDLIIYLGMARQGFANMVASILEGAAGIGTAVSNIAGWFGVSFGEEAIQTLKNYAQGFRDAGQAIYDEAVVASIAGPGNAALTEKLLEQSAAHVASTEAINTNSASLAVKFHALSAIPPGLSAASIAEGEYIASLQVSSAEQLAIAENNAAAWQSSFERQRAVHQQLITSFQRWGTFTRTASQVTADKLQADFDLLLSTGNATAAQLQAAWEKAEEAKAKASSVTGSLIADAWMNASISIAGSLAQLGGKWKKFALAEGAAAGALAILKAWSSAPWPANLPAVAATVVAVGVNLATIARQSFAQGTPGLDFANFGREMPAMLHGREAVIPQGGGHALASEIAASLGRMSSPMQVDEPSSTETNGPTNQVQNVITLDGKVLAEWYESSSKRGAVRTHIIAVKEF